MLKPARNGRWGLIAVEERSEVNSANSYMYVCMYVQTCISTDTYRVILVVPTSMCILPVPLLDY